MDIKPSTNQAPTPTPAPIAAAPEPPAKPQAAAAKPSSAGARAELIAFAILLIAMFIFGLQNLQTITVRLAIYKAELPLGVAMLIAAIAGAVLVALMWGASALKRRMKSPS